jgi:hypothetical protein
VEEWIVKIEDFTPRVAKIYALLQSGQVDKAKRLLPPEKVYTVDTEIARRVNISEKDRA